MLKDLIEMKFNLGKVDHIDIVAKRTDHRWNSAFIYFTSWKKEAEQVHIINKKIIRANDPRVYCGTSFKEILLNTNSVSVECNLDGDIPFILKFTVNNVQPIVTKMNRAQLENEIRITEQSIQEANAKLAAIQSGLPLPEPATEEEVSEPVTDNDKFSLFMPAVPKELMSDVTLRTLLSKTYAIGEVKRIDYAPNPNSAGKFLAFIHFRSLNLRNKNAKSIIDTINEKGKISLPYSNYKKTGSQVAGLLFIKNKKPIEDAKTDLRAEELESNLARLQGELKILTDKISTLETTRELTFKLEKMSMLMDICGNWQYVNTCV
jgi:hypothetical protein